MKNFSKKIIYLSSLWYCTEADAGKKNFKLDAEVSNVEVKVRHEKLEPVLIAKETACMDMAQIAAAFRDPFMKLKSAGKSSLATIHDSPFPC